jgi:hypothetical protein
MGGITIWAVAGESESRSRSKAKTKTKTKSRSMSKAAGGGARSTREKLAPKRLGEIGEAEFIAKVIGLGFVAAKPWGDSEAYDFIVNLRWVFWRVQVKSAHVIGEDGTYSFRAHDCGQRSYTAEDIDALVAYAKPEGVWYVFPVRVVEGLKSLKLYPGSRRKRSKYEKYREAWEIFRKPVRRRRRK